jgi:hypothetical protein
LKEKIKKEDIILLQLFPVPQAFGSNVTQPVAFLFFKKRGVKIKKKKDKSQISNFFFYVDHPGLQVHTPFVQSPFPLQFPPLKF